jgi:hypothetical protein
MELASDKIRNINCDPQSRLGKLRKIALGAHNKFMDSSEKLLQQLAQGAKIDDIDDLIKENQANSAAHGTTTREFMNAFEATAQVGDANE